MRELTKKIILKALREIIDPVTKQNIVDLEMVKKLQLNKAGEVVFAIEVDPNRGTQLESLRQKAENIVAALPGVTKTSVILTSQKSSTHSARKMQSNPHNTVKLPVLDLPIRHIIAIASGKGGVGKSTIAANLSVCLANNSQKSNLKIGLLDADIYGPSQPLMMGLQGQKPESNNEKIEPLNAHGIKVMSIGFMIETQAPLIWRGPMVQSAIYQLLRDVNWGTQENPLDILIVDMPPGTGDAQLTMAQKVPMSGAVIVSTPQDIALLDARKGIEMFRKTNVPILGIIENMSMYICKNCGHEEHIFGHGGARKEAEKLNVPFLGEIPLSLDIREKSDHGEMADGIFNDIAEKIISNLT